METKLFVFLASVLSCIMLDFPPFALLKFKYRFNKYYALAVIMVLDILLTLPKVIGEAGTTTIGIVVACSLPFVWCILLFEDSLWKRILVPAGFTIFIVFPLEFVTMFFMNTFWGGDAFADIAAQNEIYLAGLVLNNILYYVVMIFAILLWKRFVDKKEIMHIHIYWLVALYQTVLFVFWLRLAERFTTRVMWIGLFLAVFGMVLDAALFFYFNQMEEQLETEEKLAVLYEQRDFEKEYFNSSTEYLEQMKKMQESFLTQIDYLERAIEQIGDKVELKEFIDYSQQGLDAYKQIVYSTNSVINAILSVKAEAAKKQDIIMDIRCVHEQNVGVGDIDICSVLGNLLDNAIEACEKIDIERRKITVSITEKAGFFIIKTVNPLLEPMSKRFKVGYTSKQDVENHGLGLQLVERICKKYEGKLKLEIEENSVQVSAILMKKASERG